MQFGIFVTIIFLAGSVLGVQPSISKVYRSDYEYNERTDAFYKVHLVKRYILMADDTCKVEGAQLMVPSSKEEFAIVKTLMTESGFEYVNFVWVGLTALNLTDLEHMKGGNGSNYGSTCKVINRKGEILVDPCDRELPFICKVKAEDAVYDEQCGVYGTTGYKYFESVHSCYKVSEVAYPWVRAMTECSRQGAHLVILNSEAERLVIKEFLKTAPKTYNTAYQTYFYHAGIRAAGPADSDKNEIVFRTIFNNFNQTLEEAGYSGWSDGEPNNYGGREFCGTIFSGDGKYNDVNCDQQYAFICEKEVAPK